MNITLISEKIKEDEKCCYKLEMQVNHLTETLFVVYRVYL